MARLSFAGGTYTCMKTGETFESSCDMANSPEWGAFKQRCADAGGVIKFKPANLHGRKNTSCFDGDEKTEETKTKKVNVSADAIKEIAEKVGKESQTAKKKIPYVGGAIGVVASFTLAKYLFKVKNVYALIGITLVGAVAGGFAQTMIEKNKTKK